MTSLARCPQLVKLDLSSCSNMVTDEAVRAFLYPDFDDVPPHFASVEWMSLRACPKVWAPGLCCTLMYVLRRRECP